MPPATEWCLADNSQTSCSFACSKEHQSISHFRLHVGGLCSGPHHEQHALQVQQLDGSHAVCADRVQTAPCRAGPSEEFRSACHSSMTSHALGGRGRCWRSCLQ